MAWNWILPLAWLLSFLQEGVATLRDDVSLRHVDQNDVVFMESFLWARECASLSECAVFCMSNDECVTYSVSKPDSVNGRRQCRGHSLPVADLGSGIASQGTRIYSLRDRVLAATATTAAAVVTTTAPWHKSSCTGNTDCTPANSECFANKCLCTPGYYYSVGSDSCQSTCARSSLQQDVVEYPMYYIKGYNKDSLTTTFANCKSKCLGDPDCRSMDFRYSTDRCSTSVYTPLDVPSAWKASTSSELLYYYQKVCA